MRFEHQPYRVKITWHWFQRFWARRFLVPQFDALGEHYMIVNPWHVEVVGSGITIGECLHMVAVKDRRISLTTWMMGQSLGRIAIGDHCLISPGTRMASATEIVIGNSTMIAQGVYISDADWHGIYDRATPIGQTAPVHIGDNVWICDGVMIGKGVTIGNNSILGAGAVVVRDVPANVIVAGNPAKVVRELDPEGPWHIRADLFTDPLALEKEMDAIYRYTLHDNSYWGWLRSIFARKQEH